MDTLERTYHLKQTKAFIEADGYSLVFHRRTNATDGAGGNVPTSTLLVAQRVRIVPARTRSSSLVFTLPTGEILASKDQLMIGMPDLDVEHKDWFDWFGQAFQVTFVEPDRTFQTICQLDVLGETERSTLE